MNKFELITLLCILVIALTLVNNLKASASQVNEKNLYGTPELPEEVRKREPMPSATFANGDYLNTTNPYANTMSPQGALDEVDDFEGNNPVYVLVFGDEEERLCYREFPGDEFPVRSWDVWAKCQIERGDEALVSNFGIDIRILGFLDWDSDDSKTILHDLFDELKSETQGYIGQLWNGEWWSNYVDAIIGITAQSTTCGYAGYSDLGGSKLILKWQVYWADDNLSQHEISHWFWADDHEDNCCAMASHTHFVWSLWEDGLWVILSNIPCLYTSYSWCTTCNSLIWSNRAKFGSELIQNPSFETGDASYWTIGGYGDHRVTSEDRHSGSYSMLLGYKYSANVANARDYAYQLITIPAGTTNMKLLFWYHLFTEDSVDFDWFEVYVSPVGGEPVLKFKKGGVDYPGLEEYGWERVVIDISAYAGQSIYVYFAVANWYDTAFKTWCYIDDIYVMY